MTNQTEANGLLPPTEMTSADIGELVSLLLAKMNRIEHALAITANVLTNIDRTLERRGAALSSVKTIK